MQQETKLRLPDLSKFNYLGDGSEQNTFIDPRRGIVVNQQIFQFALSPKNFGKIKIGSATVQVNGQIYKSEPFDIYVTPEEAQKTVADSPKPEDVYLDVELQDKELYENQPTVAVLRAYSRDYSNFRKIGNIKLPKQKDLLIEPVSQRERDIESSSNVSSQILAVFSVYPQKSGIIILPAATASYTSGDKIFKIKSNSAKISVKNLPPKAPENYRNAVGDFKVSLIESPNFKNAEIDKPLDVFVKISGKGNFGRMALPVLKKSEDYASFSPKIIENITKTGKGAEGEVLAKYVVIPKKSGSISISTASFSFFSTSRKKYVQLGEKSVMLNVLSPEQVSDAKTTIEKVNDYTNNVLQKMDDTGIKTDKFQIKEKKAFKWNTVFLNYGMLLTLFLGIWYLLSIRKRRSQTVDMPIGSTKELPAFDIEGRLKDLEKLSFRGKYDDFFDEFYHLEKFLQDYVLKKENTELHVFIEREKGSAAADEYRLLRQQIQMERFAPQHMPDQVDDILRRIKNIFSGLHFR